MDDDHEVRDEIIAGLRASVRECVDRRGDPLAKKPDMELLMERMACALLFIMERVKP